MTQELKQLEPIHKTLVIGIGGTGKEVLIELKRKFLAAGYADTLNQPYFKLLSLDFGPEPIPILSLIDNNQKKVKLNSDEFISLNSENIKQRLNNLEEEINIPYFKDWYPDIANNFIRLETAQFGAAQWRPLGRVGYFEYAKIFQNSIEKKIDQLMGINYDLKSRTPSNQVVVYLVCSMAGGTGGGIFFDTAYFLRDLQPNIRKIGMFLLPEIYSDFDKSGRTFANTYAGLKELTAFSNQTKSFFAKYPKGRSIKIEALKDSSPLDLIYLYDKQIGSDTVATNISQIAEIMSESIYLDVSNKFISQAQESVYTNLNKSMNELSDQCVFNAMGNTTLVLPSINELKKYWQEKYYIQVIGSNVTEEFTINSKIKSKIRNNDIDIEDIFPEPFYLTLNSIIENDSSKILEQCKDNGWTESYIRNTGKKLSEILIKEISEKKVCPNASVIKWLEKMLITPDNWPRGNFLYDEYFLEKAIEKFYDKIENEINNSINQSYDKNTNLLKILNKLDNFFEAHVIKLKEKIKSHQKNIKNNLTEKNKGFYNKEKQILFDVYNSKPFLWFNPKDKAFTHWSIRFLNAIVDSYGNHTIYIRVYTLLVSAIEDLRKNKFKNLIKILQTIKKELKKEGEPEDQFLENLKKYFKDKSIVVHSGVNEKFLENSWDELKSKLNQKGILEKILKNFVIEYNSIIKYNRENNTLKKIKENKIHKDIKPNEIKNKIFKYVKQEIEKVFNKKEENCLSSNFQYYNPFIWLDDSYLGKQIIKAKNDFMFSNTVINKNKYDMIFVVFPQYSPNSDKQAFKKYHTKFTGLVKNIFNGISINFQTIDKSYLDSNKRGEIIIRHISLNHPTYNIANISSYYDAYNRYGKHKKLFHIHKNFESFPEVILDSQIEKFPVCGNPDCSYDLTNVPKDTLECPECHGSIKSRCGNIDCGAENLHERNDINNDNPRKYCPSCGKFLKTYWWTCKKHQTVISRESKYCRQCLEEYSAGKLAFKEVQRTLDAESPYILCPGCQNDRKKSPFKITFIDIYNNVSDSLVNKALNIYYSKNTRKGRCPECNSQLLPICPYFDTEKDEVPHFVEQGAIININGEIIQGEPTIEDNENQSQGHFYCTRVQEHAAKCIKECSYCGMPLKEDAKHCSRCKRWANNYKNEFLKLDINERKNILETKNQIYFGLPDKTKNVLRCARKKNNFNTFTITNDDIPTKKARKSYQNVSDKQKMEHFQKGLLEED